MFLPYQRRWICDESPLKIMEKSRQIGMSWSAACRVVRHHLRQTRPSHSWVASRDEVQAKLFLDDCRKFARWFERFATGRNRTSLTKNTRGANLEFTNGSVIHSLSSNPDAQAGKRGNRILDEFALHPNPKQLYSIALPGITWGGQLEIISTHRGSANFFNELIGEIRFGGNPKSFSYHRVTLEDALDQGFLEKLQAKLPPNDRRLEMDRAAYFDFVRSTCPDEATFQQEYMCNPMDDRSAFMGWDLLLSCEYDDRTAWEISLPYDFWADVTISSDCYLGVDIGRDRDLTVFWLLETIGGVAFTRRVECCANEAFRNQEKVLHDFLAIPTLRRICIDQTGIGRQFAERAREIFGNDRVEGVSFSANFKEVLAYSLKVAFENQRIRIPRDRAIEADLQSIRREVSPSGTLKFSAEAGINGHADRFWALALAWHASRVADRPATIDREPRWSGIQFWRPQRKENRAYLL